MTGIDQLFLGLLAIQALCMGIAMLIVRVCDAVEE